MLKRYLLKIAKTVFRIHVLNLNYLGWEYGLYLTGLAGWGWGLGQNGSGAYSPTPHTYM